MSLFKKLKATLSVAQSLDLEKIGKLAAKVDLNKMVGLVSSMKDEDLQKLIKFMESGKREHKFPAVDGDFYDLHQLLTPEERDIQMKVRSFMETTIKPIVNTYWLKDEFPFEIIPEFAKLNICGLTYHGYGCPGKSSLLEGFLAMEMARIDCSISTFFGVQSGLAMGSIYHCGSEAQKQQWLPPMQRMEKIGAFGLTEPEVGSGVAGGLTCTCKRQGDTWILNGQKKWIGNATFADIIIIWARDLDDGKVKGFIVEKDFKGFKAEKIKGKMALRIVQNALITLTDCEVPEASRLQNANSFKDTAQVLRMTPVLPGRLWAARAAHTKARCVIRTIESNLDGPSAAFKWFRICS